MGRIRTKYSQKGRYRSKSECYQEGGLVRYISAWSGPGPYIDFGEHSVSTIEDETGPRIGSKNRNVTHTVTKSVSKPFGYRTPGIYAGNANGQNVYTYYVKEGSTNVVNIPNGLFWNPVSDADYSRFGTGFVSSQTDHIPAAANIPNFLLELGDLKRLAVTIGDLAHWGAKTVDSFRGKESNTILGVIEALGTSRGRARFLSGASTQYANAHLAYQFGFKPAVDEIRKSLDLIDRVDRRIGHLKRTYGKRTKVVRAKEFSAEPIPQLIWNRNFGEEFQWRCTPKSHITQFKAGMEYIHTLGGLDDTSRRLAAVAQAAGFSKPLSAIYDAIPLSFLLDYVVNIGSILETVNVYQTFDGAITALDGWSSRKTQIEVVVEAWPDYDRELGKPPREVEDLSILSYSRSKGVPTFDGVRFETSLSGSQVAILASLTRQTHNYLG